MYIHVISASVSLREGIRAFISRGGNDSFQRLRCSGGNTCAGYSDFWFLLDGVVLILLLYMLLLSMLKQSKQSLKYVFCSSFPSMCKSSWHHKYCKLHQPAFSRLSLLAPRRVSWVPRAKKRLFIQIPKIQLEPDRNFYVFIISLSSSSCFYITYIYSYECNKVFLYLQAPCTFFLVTTFRYLCPLGRDCHERKFI